MFENLRKEMVDSRLNAPDTCNVAVLAYLDQSLYATSRNLNQFFSSILLLPVLSKPIHIPLITKSEKKART